jgi:hypothetical protein
MKKNQFTLGVAVVAPLVISSCSLVGIPTKEDLRQVGKTSYERGLQDGRAAEVRRRYHEEQEQRAMEGPPPNPVRYYEVSMPAHTASDGVKIEAHKLTLAVEQ